MNIDHVTDAEEVRPALVPNEYPEYISVFDYFYWGKRLLKRGDICQSTALYGGSRL